MSPTVRDAAGNDVGVVDAPQMPIADISNPLGEELIPVKVRDGVEFYNQGVLRQSGAEFDMPISMARNASMYVYERKPDGSTRAVPHELQADVVKANIAGRPRHERIEALQKELAALEARKAQVQTALDHETAQETAALAASGPVQGDAPVAQPAPGGTLAQPVGGPVAVQPATTDQTARPGEAGGNLAQPIR